MKDSHRIILALDLPDAGAAHKFLQPLGSLVKKVKIGPALFIQEGPALVDALQKKGYDVFLDLKLHDIPNTVALGVKGAKKIGVWLLSVHLSGGRKMLEEAASAASGSPVLAGITVLTSMNADALGEVGLGRPVDEQVELLARLGISAGLGALVASPLEVERLRRVAGPGVLLITPGIRFGASGDDQARTLSPREAVRAGADYLVVGRPVLQAENPKAFLERIESEIEGAGAR